MKRYLSLQFLLLCFSLPVLAQKPHRPSAGNLSIKDFEYVLAPRVNPYVYLQLRGFKKDQKGFGKGEVDTVATSNAKGDKLLLVYHYSQLEEVILKTASADIVKKLLAESASKYRLTDSVELVKSAAGVNYLQKRYAYLGKQRGNSSNADLAGVCHTFTLVNPVKQNGKELYLLSFKRIPDPETNQPVSMSMPVPPRGAYSEERMAQFREDSNRVEHLLRPGKINPIAPGLLSRMDQFLLQHIFNDFYLPVQFISHGNASGILITPDNERSRTYTYEFNDAGQLSAVTSAHQTTERTENEKQDNLFHYIDKYDYDRWEEVGFLAHRYEIEYDLNVPVKAGGVGLDYNMDTVIAVSKQSVRVYKMIDELFFLIEDYTINSNLYRPENLTRREQYTLEQRDGKIYYSCKSREDGKPIFDRCYSSSKWTLPFTVTASLKPGAPYDKVVESYREEKPNKLVRKTEEGTYTYFLDNLELRGLDNGKVLFKRKD